jgi:hypothetical protein
MDIKAAIEKLDQEWDVDEGFFGKLRSGLFDKEGLQRVIQILESVDISGEQLPKRFVALTWFIPTFMSWQCDRIIENGGDAPELDVATQTIIELLYRVLGVP